VPMGTRMPMRWVQAISYFARSARDADAWIARQDPPLGATQIEQMQKGMAFVREHSFIAHMRRPGTAPQEETAGIRAAGEDPPIVPEADLQDDKVYPLMAILAPIYDGRDRVTISLVMAGFHHAMTGADVRLAGGRMAQACERISGFLAGRPADLD